ncbi:MFS transporter [Cupriavidus pinatubonensis]|uniref:MFS transporter n=1 Tax=Cupriavidus pinatubonensis TaxID=248026 RepID=UPI0036144536
MNAPNTFRPGAAWTIVVLLQLYMLVNFLDKIALSMTAVPVMAELHMSAAEFGAASASFYWLFSLSGIIGGFLCRYIPTRWLLLGMGILWAILQIPLVFATDARHLLWCRMLLGAAEGPAYPIAMVALFEWFPNDKRSLPVSVVSTGATAGLVLAGLGIPLITAAWGWRVNFAILAVAGAIWCAIWVALGCTRRLREPGQAASATAPIAAVPVGGSTALPYRILLTDRSVIAVLVAGIGGYAVLGTTMTWLPLYLERGLGFSATAAGRWFTVSVLLMAAVGILLGGVSQRLMRRGLPTRIARARLVALCFVTGAVMMVALWWLPVAPASRVLLLAIAISLPVTGTTFGPILLAEVIPPRQQAIFIALLTALGNVAAALGALMIGRLVQALGTTNARGYELGYVGVSMLLFIAALACLRWLDTEESRKKLRAEGAVPA